jgi:hypothetical protein
VLLNGIELSRPEADRRVHLPRYDGNSQHESCAGWMRNQIESIAWNLQGHIVEFDRQYVSSQCEITIPK